MQEKVRHGLDMSRIPDGADWLIGRTNGGLTIHAKVGAGDEFFGNTPQDALDGAVAEFLAATPGSKIGDNPSPFRMPQAWAYVQEDVRGAGGPSSVMNDLELEALKRAGREAGGYLVGIGVTDMKELKPEQWQRFMSIAILGFELYLTGLKEGDTA